MILTCPECSTRYMSQEGTIGVNGRTVRCARCETVWFVEGVDPDSLALEDNQAVLIEPAPETEPEIQPELPLMTTQTVGAHTMMRNKAEAEKLGKRMRVIRAIWAVSLIGLLGAASLAYFKRQAIVDASPKAATIYQAFGMNVKAKGLDISNVESEMLIVDGETILRVSGQVDNLSSKQASSNIIQLMLENRSGESVADWYVEIDPIEAKGVAQFETDYPAPPVDGVNLRYRFAPE